VDNRIPSLDGARAVSILLVIAAHLIPNFSVPLLWRVDYGNLGVRVFFVISGFLITTLLLREQERAGEISIRSFYLRRFFRIVPVYYTFLLVMAILIPTGLILASYTALIPAAGFVSNYWFVMGTLGHTWSLSVEEQFYLIWPGALVLLGIGRTRYVCIALLFTAPIFRELQYEGVWPTKAMSAFESVCDALAIGCLLAMLRAKLWESRIYRIVVGSPLAVIAPVIALGLMAAMPSSDIVRAFALSLLNVGIALCLDHYMRYPKSMGGIALNSSPVVWIGTISYSLYLWQQPWHFNTLRLPWYIKVAGAFVCAVSSYYLIEQPFLKLRLRLTQGRAPRMPIKQHV
jgi:peptidoglycan/LPS O-acetylase OafA/YrhL